MRKKDYLIGIAAGLLIGILILPLLKTTKPDFYEKYSLIAFILFLIGTPLGLIVADFISRKIVIIWQIAKFGVIGVLNTLVDWGVLALLPIISAVSFETGLMSVFSKQITYYSLFKGISFLVAVINSYFWNKYWVFESGKSKTRAEFLQFLVVSVTGFIINVVIASVIFSATSAMSVLTEGQRGILGAAFATIASMVWNFVGYKFFVFKQRFQTTNSSRRRRGSP